MSIISLTDTEFHEIIKDAVEIGVKMALGLYLKNKEADPTEYVKVRDVATQYDFSVNHLLKKVRAHNIATTQQGKCIAIQRKDIKILIGVK